MLRSRSFLFYVVACAWVHLGACATMPSRLPEWPKTALVVPSPSPQVNSPCGPHLKDAKASFAMLQMGIAGVWIDKRRVECLLARSRVARACRGACETRVAQVTRGHDHIIATYQAVSKQREDQINRHYRSHLNSQVALVVLIGVPVLVLAFGIGFLAGKL